MAHAPRAFPAGDANPGALGLIRDLRSTMGISLPWSPRITWAIYVVVVTALSVPWWRRTWRSRDARSIVLGASLLYALLSPRLMAYGYLIAIPAILHFTRSLPGGRTTTLVVALLLSAQGLARMANQPLQGLVFHHLPFLMVLGVWLGVVTGALRGPTTASPPTRELAG